MKKMLAIIMFFVVFPLGVLIYTIDVGNITNNNKVVETIEVPEGIITVEEVEKEISDHPRLPIPIDPEDLNATVEVETIEVPEGVITVQEMSIGPKLEPEPHRPEAIVRERRERMNEIMRMIDELKRARER